VSAGKLSTPETWARDTGIAIASYLAGYQTRFEKMNSGVATSVNQKKTHQIHCQLGLWVGLVIDFSSSESGVFFHRTIRGIPEYRTVKKLGERQIIHRWNRNDV